mgnify:CR=1 FL=1
MHKSVEEGAFQHNAMPIGSFSCVMQSLVDFAEQAGGYGRWILANIETGIMQGDPTPILLSNSFAFGGFSHNQNTTAAPRLFV